MYKYAQTNIQLLDQLYREEFYSFEDLKSIHGSYHLAAQLFTGCFRPSGKTFLDHLVGTASILGSLHSPAPLVAAGLLHAAYVHGDFGIDEKGISDFKRTYVSAAVGPEIENYVAVYTGFPWNSKAMRVIPGEIDSLSALDRNVLLMRLANQLEDYLDHGILYCPNADKRMKSFERRQAFVTEIANQLGFPALATELDRVATEIRTTKIPPELSNKDNQSRAYYIERLSQRKNL